MAESLSHPAKGKNKAWAAARKAERWRDDCRMVLDALGEALDDIGGAVWLLTDRENDCDADGEIAEKALFLEINKQCAIAEGELRELWRLIDEDAP
jgi:hypothetical protein